MKYVIEFTTHDGKKLRTLPFKDTASARFAALAINITLAPHSMHDPKPEILTVPEDSDLEGGKL